MRVVLLAAVVGMTLLAPTLGADRLILRDLTILNDRSVVSFDEDGVRLDDDTLLTWDRVERGTVASDKQAAFDRLRREIGQPLYRLRLRLKVGDDLGLVEPAEALTPHFADRDSASAYLVQRALMRGYIASGRREAAVAPYIRCLAYVWNQAKGRPELPAEQRISIDPETGVTAELLPVWFDSQGAQEALAGVRQAAARMPEPRPDALRIYFASLAAAAGDGVTAERGIAGIGATDTTKEATERSAGWRDTLRLSLDVQSPMVNPAVDQLEARLETLSPLCRPLASYWIGLARLRSDQTETQLDGVLRLLHIPAEFEAEQPELAGAALAAASVALEKLDDQASAAAALRRELATRYARTRAATQFGKSRPSPASSSPSTPEPP